LDQIPDAEKDYWAHLFDAVNANTNAGIVEATKKIREHYWRHWINFLPTGFNPYLQDLALAQ